MKIIMVTNVIAPDKLGGLERYVRELSAALFRLGHDLTIVSKRTDDQQSANEQGDDGIRVIRVTPPHKKNPFFGLIYPVAIGVSVFMTVRREIRMSPHAIVHGHFPVPMLLLAIRRIPYLYTCHAPVYKELIGERQGTYALPRVIQGVAVWGLRQVEKFVIRRAHQVVTLSDFISKEVSILDRTASARLALVPGGIDTIKFRPAAKVHGYSAGAGPVLFTARRLVTRTGVEELVASMPLILRELPTARLFIAGDGRRRPDVEAVIRENNLDGCVELLGRISDAELIERYQQSDISVTPTQHLEGFGLSTAESLACGTPAIVTPVGANGEVVGDLSPDLVTKNKTSRAIADTIISLWQNQSALQSIRARARDQVHPSFSWPRVAQQHEELYIRTIGLRITKTQR